MRSPFVPLVVLAVLIALPLPAAAQGTGSGSGSGSGSGAPTTSSRTSRSEPGEQTPASQPSPAALKGRSNVQLELTISDQTGSGAVEKKTVSMIAASGTWGKIRAAGVVMPKGETRFVGVGLNVDARPFLFADGVVQVELTLSYNPLGAQALDSAAGVHPTELNQSMTVVLQNGKPLVVSQAADPVSDRRIVVEVKATVLK